ncbi:GDSL-like lipase/acylhydrolase [Apiospora sp. TS-2023a]
MGASKDSNAARREEPTTLAGTGRSCRSSLGGSTRSLQRFRSAVPPIKNADGSNITIENLRGTRLFGWDGCDKPQGKKIRETWDEFHSLVSQDGIKDNIDWKGQAAQDFFGAPEGKGLPQDVQAHIQQIYQAAEAMWTHWWTDWLNLPDEPFAWKWLWIQVTCSGGNGKGDPDDRCQERGPSLSSGMCPLKKEESPAAAVTVSGRRYTQVIFCKHFFEQKGLQEMTDIMQGEKYLKRLDLQSWDNKASTFLHEVTHMDYFMNVPGYGPQIRDWDYPYDGQWHNAYGVLGAKMLGRYDAKKNPGAVSQANADNLAFFALAKWVESHGKENRYPHLPALDTNQKPSGDPRPADRDRVDSASGPPACPSSEEPPSPSKPSCNEDSSDVDAKLFGDPSGAKKPLFDSFCGSLDTSQKKKVTVDSNGKSVPNASRRSPPPNPSMYNGYTFAFSFTPVAGGGGANCQISCQDAFASVKNECGNRPSEYYPLFHTSTVLLYQPTSNL